MEIDNKILNWVVKSLNKGIINITGGTMFSAIIDFIMGIWNLLMVIPVVISICSVIVAFDTYTT
jgi:uncharacterized membrane protein